MYEKDCIEILTANSSHSFPLHSHESFCLGIVTNGKVCFQIDNQEKVLSKGMCYLIPSNIGVVITPIERYRYTTICFKNEKKEYLMNYDYTDYFPALNIFEQLNHMCKQYISGGSSQTFMDGIVSILKCIMIEKKSTMAPDDDLIMASKKFIHDHIYEKFDLDALAAYVHMSKYHFIRKFKKLTGVTPNQYCTQVKLSAVKKALIQDKKETTVAVDFNFTDQSYLCNVFKRQMGISMKDYKKNFTLLE